jgi:serine/threonine protein kinase
MSVKAKIDVKKTDYKYIGEGSYGCVFDKPIPCASRKAALNTSFVQTAHTTPRRLVSKVFAEYAAFEKELKATKLAAEVDPAGKVLLLPTKACELRKKTFVKIRDASHCTNIERKKTDTTDTYYQLIMPYGGTRIDDYVKSKSGMSLFKFLDMIEPLITSLELLNKNKVSHNDIKSGNVLVTPHGKVMVIDHTLMIPYSLMYSREKYRRLNMAYYPYPPEFRIVYDIIHNNLIDIESNVNQNLHSFGQHKYDAYASFVSARLLKDSIKDVTDYIVSKIGKHPSPVSVASCMNSYVDRVDVYSVGMMLSSLTQYIDMTHVSSKTKKSFNKFIMSMVHPNMMDRVSPEHLRPMYDTLVSTFTQSSTN